MKPAIRLTLCDDAGQRFFGEGPLTLLTLTQTTGSLRAAAKEMHMAYTKAHAIIARAESELGFALTAKHIGGRGGGGSVLTPEAEALIDRYCTFKAEVSAAADQSYRRIFELNLPRPPVIGCVLMASGFSRRFGPDNKLLADFKGIPLFEHALKLLEIPAFHRSIAVTRYPEIAAVCRDRRLPCIRHDLPYQSDTLRLGIDALADTGGCLFLPADLPLLTAASLEGLIADFTAHPQAICRLAAGEHLGPAIFPSDLYAALASLEGETGGGAIIKAHAERVRLVPAPEIELTDADTPEALRALAAL